MMNAKAMRKAAKKSNFSYSQPAVNLQALDAGLKQVAELAIQFNPEQGYNESEQLNESAEMLVTKFGRLSKENFRKVLGYREDLEDSTSSNFGVTFVTGMMTFCWDADAALKAKNVPQIRQVHHGLIDLVIGKMVMRGASI